MILKKSKKETTNQLRPSSLLLQLRKNPLMLKTSRLELGIDPVVNQLGWWKEGWDGKSRTGGRDGGSGRSCRNGRDGGAVKNI